MDTRDPGWYMHPAVAAAAGSILGLRAMPGASLGEKIINLGLGFLFALFIGPLIVETMSVTNHRVSAGIIFAAGAAGLVVFGAVIDGIKQTPLGPVFSGWLSIIGLRRLPSCPPDNEGRGEKP